MKYKIFIVVLVFAVLSGSTIWNKMQFNKIKIKYQDQISKNISFKKSTEEIKDALIKGQIVSMNHLGKKIFIDNKKRIYPKEEQTKNSIKKHPRLILVFNELSCNVCQDIETKFAIEVAEMFGNNYVIAIVHATSRRYVNNYIKINKVNFPVNFFEDDSFLKKYNIRNTPMILIIDENDRIINSYYPIPGQNDYSKPFHKFCINYFYKFNKHGHGQKVPVIPLKVNQKK